MKKIAIAGALAFLVVPSFAQNLVTNGGFETESSADAAIAGYVDPKAGDIIDGWTFAATTTALSNTYIESLRDTSGPYDSVSGQQIGPASGTYFASFGASFGSNPPQSTDYDELSQLINTTAGTTYKLSYSGYMNGSDYLQFAVDSTVVSSIVDAAYTGQWETYTATFVGTGGQQNFQIYGYNPSGFSTGVDNISITAQAAPEPMSMIALGLGAVGILRRRTRR